MSIEENKKVVLDYFAASKAGDVEKLKQLIADDAKRWMIPGTPFSGVADKAEMIGAFEAVSSASDGPFDNEVEYVTAEEDRVSVTAKSELKLKSGKVYSNVYHFLFFVENGQIKYIKEYFNTAHFNEVFTEEELAKLG
ncbi:nuclear transport factor 2 family protein [Henriciella aquimarina]|uniref:nuclear transport factor 2 family protein n=1 Tax=Henriciella aquimarina TaxID=545261 RepID=UPI000A06D376|nr:nuclear transport factor 2 family protein [Henriciella aquimarina]